MCYAGFKINIRAATAADLPAVYALIKELAIYENAPQEPTNTLEAFLEDGTGDHPKYHVILAELGTEIIGMALYYLGYSTWKGRMMYLDDLIVREQWRRKGIGLQLMNHLIDTARKLGVHQLRWHVLDWNEPAIAFYQKIGAHLDPSWITCKIEKDQLYP